ncbi:MAG: DUF2911 domain-containing protein [Planctomycetota bacterium]
MRHLPTQPLSPVLSLVAATLVASCPAAAQIRKPSLSPRSVVQQDVGLARATVDYGRPGVKGRTIFGALEPYGKVWRTGANQSTKLTFDRAVTFGGEALPAGTYGLYTIPNASSWTVILSKNSTRWGAGGYDPAEDQLRVQVAPETLGDLRETLTIEFESFHMNGATLVIAWERTRVRVPVFVDSDEEILASIDERVRTAEGEVSAQSYFDAAMFLYAKDRDLDEATAWMAKATELQPRAFWMTYYRAELAHYRGNDALARRAATDALASARGSKGGDFGYVAKCELLLKAIEG